MKSIRRQRIATDFLVIAQINTAISKGGMAPDELAAAGEIGWLDEVCAADFLVALGAELGDDEVAFFVMDEKPILVLDQKRIRPTAFGAGNRPGGGKKDSILK